MRVVLCDKRLITALMARTAVNNCLIPYSSMPTKASGDLISEIATQTRHEDARLMRKYKRRLLMILGSIDSDGHLSQVRITNLATSSDGRILTVFWTMAEGSHSDITAWKVDNLLRNANKSIRQRLARENAFRKVPILNFIHSPSDLLSDPTEDQVDVNSCHIVKPNNVYGLPWDEYMKEVRRNRQDDAVMVDSENMDADCHRERGSCPSQAANWARRWQKQHNAKLVAKRERKRSHQMLEEDRCVHGEDGDTWIQGRVNGDQCHTPWRSTPAFPSMKWSESYVIYQQNPTQQHSPPPPLSTPATLK